MKKFYMLCAVLMVYASTAMAGVFNLISQDFEGTSDVASLGWASANLAGGMSITGDEYGNYFQFNLGSNNGRNCYCLWGADIYEGKLVDGTYHIELEWNYATGSNNQYGTELTIFSNENCVQNNGSYVGNANAQWLFSMTELDADRNFKVNNDETNTFIVTPGSWMKISLDVDVNARTVAYSVTDIFGSTTYTEGVRTVPEEMSMYATGLNQYNARYYSVVQMDNIKVQVITDYDIANPPTVALVGVNGTERSYNISFLEEEELHIKGTDGVEQTVSWMDCDGTYVYRTNTSGTLEAWTVSGSATSAVVSTEVECVNISLPAATAAITAVESGYGKTFTLNVDNSEVPTKPTIFLEYTFVNEDGVIEAQGADRFSGEQVTVKSKGTLTVTSIAPGFTSTTTSIYNGTEFQIADKVDFQHKTQEELIAMGFQAMDDLDSNTTSGEGNWTARQRLYFEIATGETDEEGNPTYTKYVMHGPSELGLTPIKRTRYLQSKLNEETAHSLFAPVYTWYGTTGVSPRAYFEEDGVTPLVDPQGAPGGTTNLQIKGDIGLVFSGQVNDNEDYNPNSLGYSPILINNVTLGVDGLTDEDFIVVRSMKDYGSSSVHPQFPAGTSVEDATAEYFATDLGGVVDVYTGLSTFSLYRVQDAITSVTVMKAKTNGIEDVSTGKVVSDHNAPIYNLNGVQVNPNNLQRGIYIKQGKKFIVR